jgi:DNA-binding transcriptional ArsR family regulator
MMDSEDCKKLAEIYDEGTCEEASEYLKALAHPTRLKIVRALMGGELCVKSLWETLGLPQANVSQHLMVLKNQNIITSRRDGPKICYSLSDKRALKILPLIFSEASESEEK